MKTFLCLGDDNKDEIKALVDSGADLIEIDDTYFGRRELCIRQRLKFVSSYLSFM